MSYRFEIWTITQNWMTVNEIVKKKEEKKRKGREKMKKTKKIKAKN